MTDTKAIDFSKETIADAEAPFFEYLTETGVKEGTLTTYRRHFNVIIGYFKPTKLVQKIMPTHVALFLKSDDFLNKPKGGLRAKPTADQLARVLRMFLNWGEETKRFEKAPIPQDIRMGARSKKERKKADAKPKKAKRTEQPSPEANQPEPEPEETVTETVEASAAESETEEQPDAEANVATANV